MQQINLYTEEFRPRKVVLPLDHIAAIGVVTLVLVVILSWFTVQSRQELDQQVAKRSGQVKSLQQQVETLEQKAKGLRRDESIAQANRILEQKAEQRRQMLKMLDTIVVDDGEGFSPLLLGLARQKSDSLWLTGIHIANAGADLAIEGETARAGAVPDYLQNLRNEPSFVGRAFSLFSLAESEQQKGALEFSLKSQRLAVSGETNMAPAVVVSGLKAETGAVK